MKTLTQPTPRALLPSCTRAAVAPPRPAQLVRGSTVGGLACATFSAALGWATWFTIQHPILFSASDQCIIYILLTSWLSYWIALEFARSRATEPGQVLD